MSDADVLALAAEVFVDVNGAVAGLVMQGDAGTALRDDYAGIFGRSWHNW